MNDTAVKKIGLIPLKAFFVGLGLVIIAILLNLIFPYQGGWPALSRAVIFIFILMAAGVYSVGFFIVSLYLCWTYSKHVDLNVVPAQWAAGLYGSTIILLLLFWFSI
ncbi:hypothetical protein [Acinetobacter puyangensis]|uniref:hypothetical protein n=1 Tax=Acinetobacter puyangensis TaxID=1096779 RepID=UPI003A4E2FDD